MTALIIASVNPLYISIINNIPLLLKLKLNTSIKYVVYVIYTACHTDKFPFFQYHKQEIKLTQTSNALQKT